jgi:prepilin-type N-terminal cleavage/methylation domain-containing protein
MFPPIRATPHDHKSAFSLLELLVVIAIMGILAGMSIAIAPGVLRANAMSSSLSSVASAVSLARSDAVRSRKQTYFALAPVAGSLDERSFVAYAILRKEDASGTNFVYVNPWKKLPSGVLFRPDAAEVTSQLPVSQLPYPREFDPARALRVISFLPDGSLDEEMHSKKPVLPLQAGTRASPGAPAEYQGQYITNHVLVERLSGKVKVERAGE